MGQSVGPIAMRRQWCPVCGCMVRVGPDGDDACPKCGYTDPAGFADQPPAGGEVALAEEPLGGPLGQALGLPRGYAMLLFGGPGTGKSTLAMLAMPNAGVLSTEQDAELVAAYRRRLQLPWTPPVRLVVDDEGRPVDVVVDGEIDGLVVDSLSMAPCDVLELAKFFAKWCAATDQPAILIAHETKDGTARGPLSLAHAVHVVVRLERVALGRTISVEKRRTGLSGHVVPFRLEEDTAEPRYYSIEGHTGRYQLAEHPARGAEYAAPLLAWERDKLELPPPPLAVAARASRQSQTGFLAPSDIAARRAFAAGFGLDLWSPK